MYLAVNNGLGVTCSGYRGPFSSESVAEDSDRIEVNRDLAC